MHTTEYFDVVICGAGPAGSTCALALGNSGLRVALVDKSNFPRDKICGDAVAAYVPKVLSTINPKYADALRKFTDKQEVNSVRIVAPNQNKIDIKFSENGFISTRLNFDNFLFEQASQLPQMKVFLDTPITNVEIHEHVVTVSAGENLRFESQLVIGCDGAQSIVNKKLTNTKIDLKHYSGAVRAYFKNVGGIDPHTFEFHFLQDILPGYFWIFPLPDNNANVGLGMLSQAISDRRINLRSEMVRLIETVPYLAERFAHAERLSDIKGYGLPLGSQKVTLSGERFMLCGDAASLIDPATGEGIGQAMISGRYAGWQAIECFKKNDFTGSFLKHYDTMVYDKLWKDHSKRYRLQRIINNSPWVINAAVNLAKGNKFFHKSLEKVIW